MPPTRSRATSVRFLAAALLAAAALHAVLLRPVARHAATDIPRTSRTAEAARRVPLAPGDHLQLLYHFQLVAQMVRGEIPPFANPWEFNLGTDARAPDPYYVPFSLVYAALERPLGPAGAWNAAQLASVLVGGLFLALLARRHVGDVEDGMAAGAIAFAAAVAAMAVPYRWETLAGGSPTGFGMAWVPGVALGIDIAVRDRRIAGGLLAGLCLLLCYTSDLHCFLFAGLAVPPWCAVAWLAARKEGGAGRAAAGAARALAPLGVAAALALAVARHLRRAYAATDAAGGRSIADLRCPSWDGLLDPAAQTFMASQFFLGWGIVLAVAVAAVLAVRALMRRNGDGEARRRALAALLLALAAVFAVLLAIAQRGPWQGLVLRAVRKLVPPFRMVRQPIKVFSLLPALLAPLFAWTLGEGIRGGRRTVRLAALAALPIACLVPVLRSMRAGTCTLPRRPNAVYEAVAADAAARGETARALVLPIWPGDSSWSSLYQFHAASAKLRMVNGYAAVKTRGYVEDVFGRYQTVTQGELTDDDLAALGRHGVTAIILHEDAFPDKVSPASFGATLRRLSAHPRLRLLAQDGPVRAWRIVPVGEGEGGGERGAGNGDEAAGAGRAFEVAPALVWHFDPPFPPAPGRPLKAPLHKTARWMRDSFRWHVLRADGTHEILPAGEEDARGTAWLRLDSGAPVRDLLYAPTPFIEPGFLPAADLFHAGFTLPDRDGFPLGVDLSGVPAGSVAIHGPKLLLREPGRYAACLDKSGDGSFRAPARIEVWLGNRLAAERAGPDFGTPSDIGTWLPFEHRDGDGPLDIRLVAGAPDDPDAPAGPPLLVHGFHVRKLEGAPAP